MSDTLPIAETFGPTFQGEGPSTGRLASFVRLGGCNLTCSGCDTPYTWDAARFDLRRELTARTVPQILANLPHAPLTVITGGEPLMYQHKPAFGALLAGLADRGSQVEIETNGTIVPDRDVLADARFNVSPKLDGPMSSDPARRRIVPAALEALAQLAHAGAATFKFVASGPDDLAQVLALVKKYRIPLRAVWVMPEGVTEKDTLRHARLLADPVLSAGLNLTLRQHVLLWPDTVRGR